MIEVVARVKKPRNQSCQPCTATSPLITILIPFSNLNINFAIGVLVRSLVSSLTDTGTGLPLLSIQVIPAIQWSIHPSIHPYIHQYINTSTHPSIHPSINTSIYLSINTSINTPINTPTHTGHRNVDLSCCDQPTCKSPHLIQSGQHQWKQHHSGFHWGLNLPEGKSRLQRDQSRSF